MKYTDINTNHALNAQKIHQNWLSSIDDEIRINLDELTCQDFLQIYYALFRELKVMRSTSAGFTGFSEYLIFRALYHYLGGDFQNNSFDKNLDTQLVQFDSEKYQIAQGYPIKMSKNKSIYPDISIYKNQDKNYLRIIEIKLTFGGGSTQLTREVKRFEVLKKCNENVRGLYVVYLKPSEDALTEIRKCGYNTVVFSEENTKQHKLVDYFKKLLND